MKPRCVVTGSCYGLGLALVHTFKDSFDIIEYDISLGQDLNQPEVRDQLIEDLKTSTVFFNNSQAHQIELLERAFELQNNLAIVVSSTSAGFYSRIPEDLAQNLDYLNYCELKRQLNQRINQLQDLQEQDPSKRNCWLLNLRMNWLDVEEHRDRTESKMDPGDVAALVLTLLGMWPRVAVQEIVCIAPTVNGA